MKLIDADALRRELKEIYEANNKDVCDERDVFYCDAIDDAIKKVDSAPTALQWVSVENELPPPETLVLVYHRAGFFHKRVNETMQITIGSYSNKWHSGFTGNGLSGVTHWMPLPPPPDNQQAQ